MKLVVNPIKPKKELFDYTEYKAEITEAAREVGAVIADGLNSITRSWRNVVTFRVTVRVTVGAIETTIAPTGSNARIWRYVDEGTRAHIIRPRRAKALRFRTGYSARTQPGRPRAGTGKASGPIRFAQIVHHPGNAARGFTAAVLRANKRVFEQAIRDAVEEASQ